MSMTKSPYLLLIFSCATNLQVNSNSNKKSTSALTIGASSMGVIAPTAKKLWGDAPKSPPQEFCYIAIVHSQKGTIKITNVSL